MPQRCSIPGCRTGYKQGLMLLCYPKDPVRRHAWLQTVRNAGLDPTNNQFICELHFGPEQWEKVRVDGTKKLKWSGVPNVLDPDEVATALDRLRRSSEKTILARTPLRPNGVQAEPIHDFSFSPNILRKVIKLENAPPGIKSESESGPNCNFVSGSTFFQSKEVTNAPIVKIVSSKNDRLQIYPKQVCSKDTIQSEKECELPLSVPGHSIIIKLPKSRHQSSLMEDLDDVKSFLNATQRKYEERLVCALQELVKKHELLDQKMESLETARVENIILKEKLKSHEKVLVENYSLKEKLLKYERRASVEKVFKQTSSTLNETVIKVERMEDTDEDLPSEPDLSTLEPQCSLVLPEGDVNTLGVLSFRRMLPGSTVIYTSQNEGSFASLNDQL